MTARGLWRGAFLWLFFALADSRKPPLRSCFGSTLEPLAIEIRCSFTTSMAKVCPWIAGASNS